jgi:uncharacterized protein (DUF305 family)
MTRVSMRRDAIEQAGRDDPADLPDEPLGFDDEPDQPRWRPSRGLVVGALAALLALAIGFGGGVWVAAPHYPGDSSVEAGFARDMITHHGQAVSMATTEYGATSNGALRQIAVDIALTQQAQIGMMSTWLDTWGLTPTSTAAPMSWMPDGGKALLVDGRMPGMATDAQITQLQTGQGNARDLLFCKLMIAHHLGGIHMVDAVLKQTDNSQVRALAQTIKESQQGEINALEQAQAKLTK